MPLKIGNIETKKSEKKQGFLNWGEPPQASRHLFLAIMHSPELFFANNLLYSSGSREEL